MAVDYAKKEREAFKSLQYQGMQSMICLRLLMEAKRDEAVDMLSNANDEQDIFRAQGRLQLAKEMLRRIDLKTEE